MKKIQVFLMLAVLISSFAVPGPVRVQAATLPANFQESIVFSGLTNPTNLRFASDGRVFIAEKSGIIKVFDNLSDTTPTVFADLGAATHNFWDRGLLGMALDPAFPSQPYVYVLYTYDYLHWGDTCPTPPGATTDGCLVRGRLSRLQANGNVMTGEQVLIDDWCQQFPSHSIGDLQFGPDGALYVSGGDGASFNNVDYGQYGNTYAGDQRNPCGDPPGGVGGAMTSPTAEGGALRSLSLHRNAGEPVVLDGTLLRLDPQTGNGLSGNPLYNANNPGANTSRIIAEGMRNPFRFTFRPGTSEIWIGDVGWNTWEEINRIVDSTVLTNFGWPCYEGNNSGSAIQDGYQGANLNICNTLYSNSSSVTAPYYAYIHGAQIVSGETCSTANGSVISAIAFYSSGSYPASYNGALFFGDHSRNCIWVMFPGSNGLPDKTKISNFVLAAANPVDLEIGPGGDLFYVDFDGGTIRRVTYAGAGNQPPVSVISANPTTGTAPLTVSFSGTGSYDPDAGDGINAYSWDLNGDDVFGDSTAASTSYTYTTPGTYTARLQVTDKHGATATSSVTINANNTAPTAFIDTPAACPSTSPCWSVGQTINFSGHATDPQDGNLQPSALTWSVIIHHCIDLNSCHTHTIQTFNGVSSGSFAAPDHAYPSYLEIQLTATDSGGLQNTAGALLYPRTVNITMQSNPTGLQLVMNGVSSTTSFTRTVIVNSTNSVSAPATQTLNGIQYNFQSWSNNADPTPNFVAGSTNAMYTANYIPLSAEVQIVKTGVLSSGKITYTLQIKNNGPATAQNVTVRDVIPNRLQYFSVNTNLGSCTGGSTVTCSLGNMSNGQTATITIVVNVVKAAGYVTNTATVNSTSPDQNTANNSSSVQVKTR